MYEEGNKERLEGDPTMLGALDELEMAARYMVIGELLSMAPIGPVSHFVENMELIAHANVWEEYVIRGATPGIDRERLACDFAEWAGDHLESLDYDYSDSQLLVNVMRKLVSLTHVSGHWNTFERIAVDIPLLAAEWHNYRREACHAEVDEEELLQLWKEYDVPF